MCSVLFLFSVFFVPHRAMAVSSITAVANPTTNASAQPLVDSYLQNKINGLNKVGNVTPQILIGRVIRVAMQVLGSIALLMFVYAGLVMMTGTTKLIGSGDETDRIKRAQGIFVSSAVGLLVILMSYALVDFVLDIF